MLAFTHHVLLASLAAMGGTLVRMAFFYESDRIQFGNQKNWLVGSIVCVCVGLGRNGVTILFSSYNFLHGYRIGIWWGGLEFFGGEFYIMTWSQERMETDS
jgi:hypothetical protein